MQMRLDRHDAIELIAQDSLQLPSEKWVRPEKTPHPVACRANTGATSITR
jgi:hypothetical protein